MVNRYKVHFRSQSVLAILPYNPLIRSACLYCQFFFFNPQNMDLIGGLQCILGSSFIMLRRTLSRDKIWWNVILWSHMITACNSFIGTVENASRWLWRWPSPSSVPAAPPPPSPSTWTQSASSQMSCSSLQRSPFHIGVSSGLSSGFSSGFFPNWIGPQVDKKPIFSSSGPGWTTTSASLGLWAF